MEFRLLEQKFDMATRLQEERVLRERDRSQMAERMRLVRDMHDGFGSQLASARVLVERGRVGRTERVRTIEECLADLHLFVDVIGSEDASLADAIADYRYRIQRRLEHLPVGIQWKVDLEDTPAMPRKSILQVMRIVQEALNNAIRHAEAHQIRIEAAREPSGDLRIRIVDDGSGILLSCVVGWGIGNMRRRAADIGARLEFLPANPGTAVTRIVPAPASP